MRKQISKEDIFERKTDGKGRFSLPTSKFKNKNLEIAILEVREESDFYPCPECGEEMTIQEMINHRYEDHDLLISEQIEDIPEDYQGDINV